MSADRGHDTDAGTADDDRPSEEAFTVPVYYEDDPDRSYIDDATVAVIGYGSQGHAHAQNLNDSGVDVVVGLRKGSSSRDRAEADGLRVATPRAACEQADVTIMLVPDNVQAAVYESIAPGLDPGDTLMFAHGFAIHYGQIEPPEGVDVTMVAPKSPGQLVRRNYVQGAGTPALVAVYRDATETALDEALAYGHAIGCARAGLVETSFQEEVETDLFGEQAVLCGGVTSLIKHGYETLVEDGYAPEMAYFECLNELKLIVDQLYEGGLMGMWNGVSDTAEYGGLTRGDEILDEHVRANMEATLDAVQSGEFAREWITENRAGRPAYRQYRAAETNHEIEAVGQRLRGLFAWSEGGDAATETETATATDDPEPPEATTNED